LFALPLLASAGLAVFALTTSSPTESASPPQENLGQQLFQTQCSSCHGVDGRGVDGRGPSLEPEGQASADFVLRTGRMPIAAPGIEARRGPVRFTETEIVALVDYVASIGTGPDTPDVDPAAGDLGNGGELYRLNCAACHAASGAGAAIGGGRDAPDLLQATATQVGQAIVIGPGSMPVFGSFTEQDINDVAAYVEELRAENTTGPTKFGGVGPVAEGLAAWLLALVPLIALTRWIGR
jgi:ubiquinol-cytochrome c reductase cytochrome c subunit